MTPTSDDSQRRYGSPDLRPEFETSIARQSTSPPRQAQAAETPSSPEPIEHPLYVETAAEDLQKQGPHNMPPSEALRAMIRASSDDLTAMAPAYGTGALRQAPTPFSSALSQEPAQPHEKEDHSRPPTIREAASIVLDTTISTEKRLTVYQAWYDHRYLIYQNWVTRGKPSCTQCNKLHPGDCLSQTGDLDIWKVLQKEGKMLLKKANTHTLEETAAKEKDKDKEKEKERAKKKVEATEKAQANEKKKEKEKARKAYYVLPCPVCARLHTSACRERPCTRCGRAHPFRESCGVAKVRFEEAGVVETERERDASGEVANLIRLASKVQVPEVLDRLAAIIDRAASGAPDPEGNAKDEVTNLIRLAKKVQTPEALDHIAVMIDHAARGEKRKVDSNNEDASERPTKLAKSSRRV